MDEAERCHRLAYIAYSKLMVHGTIDEINQAVPLTTWLVTGKNLMKLAEQLKKQPGVDQVVVFGTGLHVSGASEEELLQSIRPFQQPPYTWTPVPSSIEDIFIHLVDEHPGTVTND